MEKDLYLLDYERKLDTIQTGRPVIKTSHKLYTYSAMLRKKDEIINELNRKRENRIKAIEEVLEKIDYIYEKCEVDYAPFGNIYRISIKNEPEVFNMIKTHEVYNSIINDRLIYIPPKELLIDRLNSELSNLKENEIKWDSVFNNYSFRRVSNAI